MYVQWFEIQQDVEYFLCVHVNKDANFSKQTVQYILDLEPRMQYILDLKPTMQYFLDLEPRVQYVLDIKQTVQYILDLESRM